MSRKPISDEVQKQVLMKSRRRCCLCFWLEGKDEVQKGQIAHIDGDSSNSDESNLAFLCFDHHDDFDGTTRLAKGLRKDEVSDWRDALYEEMAYRFRSNRSASFFFEIKHFRWTGPHDEFYARFVLRNEGENSVRTPTVRLQLTEGMHGKKPPTPPPEQQSDLRMGFTWPTLDYELSPMTEEKSNLFENNGRVAMKQLSGINPVLMPGESYEFEGLTFHEDKIPFGSKLNLKYRIDTEDAPPAVGSLQIDIPTSLEGFFWGRE